MLPGSKTLVNMATNWQFKILYDGDCPFCKLEIKWLQSRDKHHRLAIEDIAAADFDASTCGKTMDQLMGSIHGIFPDGTLISGMETFRQAYRAAGMGWLMVPTGWPVLKPIFDMFYRLFAANRIKMGRKFGRNCDTGHCKINP